ncbi:ankyrin repeat domain-containing protein 10 isoform X5 [Amblyraja radiata]|uniref:ankyrin repeat domain-containing protein 10 isoform X5 n=1 Tax=Amblyraja radiata TaxID=386614 RepID=UPI001402EC93|nr:ankyrin repeat domain-containing protein 10 isoform X5 [Amblyraja radiata]
MLWVKPLSTKQRDREVWIALMSLSRMGLQQIILERGITPNRNAETATGASWKPYSCGNECAVSLPLSTQGIPLSLRNANGLTAAQLALAQGFGECSQFLCSVQNHQLNGFYTNGIASGLYRGNLITDGLNGYTGTNRKRSYEESDCNGFKKPRTEGLFLSTSAGGFSFLDKPVTNQASANGFAHSFSFTSHQVNGGNGDLRGMAAEFTGGFCNGPASPPRGGSTFQGQGVVVGSGLSPPSSEMCGALHQNGSPSNYVAAKPLTEGLHGEHDPLHYGHYHGFGDTAESIPDNSYMEHSSSVKVEQSYNNAVCSAVHLFHGS